MKKSLLFLFLVCAGVSPYAQVTQINNNGSLDVTVPLGNNKTIVVSDKDSSIWITDATLPGTIQLSTDIKFIEAAGLISGNLVFAGTASATGAEIYITDGTTAGTVLVKDIFAGTTGSQPADIALLNGIIYFTAVTALQGRELWRTDGTLNGTTLVKDILPGIEGSNNKNRYELFSNGSFLLFAAKTPSSGIELWKSDGTTDGTVLLKDISPMADSSNPHAFFKYNTSVLFLAADTAHGEEIWKTDGTPGGTVLLKDIRSGNQSSTTFKFSVPGFPQFDLEFPIFLGFHLFNTKVYFSASDGTSNGQIWVSDGTESNTVLLKDIFPGVQYPLFPLAFVANAVNLPTKFIFSASDAGDRSELWESDGTTAGTKVFKAFSALTPGDIPFILLSRSFNFSTGEITQQLFQGNKFFFTANDSAHGRELWISDGTPGQTTMVKDINPGLANAVDSVFTSYLYTNTALYFAANDSTHGNELWTSDGTMGGTSLVKDINPDEKNSDPELPFFLANGKIIFNATDGDDTARYDLYVVDGNFTPLPIKLSEFTVRLKANDALLQWSTLHELNTKDFTIQRSYDGQHFEAIGTVAASTASSAKHDYSFTDKDISNSGNNIIYYRIIATDKNGKTETTNVIFVKLKGNDTWSVKLLTNPVQNFANLMLNGITKEVQISIKDISGRVFYSALKPNVNGQINIPATHLQKGMYILIAESNNERKTIQFIKQ